MNQPTNKQPQSNVPQPRGTDEVHVGFSLIKYDGLDHWHCIVVEAGGGWSEVTGGTETIAGALHYGCAEVVEALKKREITPHHRDPDGPLPPPPV